MRRGKLGGCLLPLLSLAALCGCTGWDASADRTVVIGGEQRIILDFVYAGGDSSTNLALGEVIGKFNASQKRIKVVGTPATGLITYDEYLKTKAAVGEFPDMLDMRDTQTYADAGRIVPLPEVVADLLDNPAAVNGKVYTAPLVVSSPLGILYNKSLFAQAGITEEPATWADFLGICRRLKEMGVTPLAVGGKDLWHMGFWQSFFMGNEVYADHPDWNRDRKAGKVHFSDDNVVRAMEDMTELWTGGYVNKDWLAAPDSQMASLLTSGKAAMLYEGSWMFNTVLETDPSFPLGFFAPRDREGRLVTVGKPAAQGISLTAKAAGSPEKVEAFTEFMTFFYRKDIYADYLRVTNGISGIKEPVAYDAPEATVKLMSILRDPQAVNVHYMHAYGGENRITTEFRDWLWRLMQQWLSTGSPDVKEAMRQADREFDRLQQAGKQ